MRCGFAAAGEIENKVRDREGAITNSEARVLPGIYAANFCSIRRCKCAEIAG
jgi:hypothetical protein